MKTPIVWQFPLIGIFVSALFQPLEMPAAETDGPASSAGQPAFTTLKFGDIKPRGWILAQMRRDLQTGFAGHLDELCSEAASDIFATGRNRPGKPNAGHSDSYAWWNGETEGNWHCGLLMMACLTGEPAAMKKAKDYVEHILATQDADGYIGIYSPELRYRGNGDLWAQTCLFRGLLAYGDATGDQRVASAVRRAVDRTIAGYADCKNIQFAQHDALYTDVLEMLYARTGDRKYLDFGLRIYRECPNLRTFLQQPETGGHFQRCYQDGHGATVAEAMRMSLWFWLATGQEEYKKEGLGVISAMNHWVMPDGALVSDESVDHPPLPWDVGCEYCTIFEREFTLLNAGQKTGEAADFEAAEHLWFNAGQGLREADGSAILYCSTENRLSVHDELNQRQRFSPTHQEVAVCCNPNATRIAAYFISDAWMRPADAGPALAAVLYGPSAVNTVLADVPVRVEEKTGYPYDGDVEFVVHPATPVTFTLWLRNPDWSGRTKIACSGGGIRRAGAYWQVSKEWKDGDTVAIHFKQTVRKVPALGGEFALQYGPLLYVLPVKGEVQAVKTYANSELKDYYVNKTGETETDLFLPADRRMAGFVPKHIAGTNPDFPLDDPAVVMTGKMLRKDGGMTPVTLVPIGAKTADLRRVTFRVNGIDVEKEAGK